MTFRHFVDCSVGLDLLSVEPSVPQYCPFSLVYIVQFRARHRLGYFRTHDRRGEDGADPPCYLKNHWSYWAPRGMGSYRNVKFWRFCMMKPRAGNIDSFCSKLSPSNLKGLVKMPCEHKCHTNYVKVRWRKVTKIKEIFFRYAAYDLWSIVPV